MIATNERSPRNRSLTVSCVGGLGNRLRLLVTGMTVAAASGRRFEMLWPRTRACAASFAELFTNPWPVRDPSLTEMEGLAPYLGWYSPPVPDVLTAAEDHLALLTPHMLLAPGGYPGHAALVPQCAALLEALQPLPALREQIAALRAAHFRLRMIGVHLRRGDFVFIPSVSPLADNLGSSFRTVDKMLRRWPDAGIFLSSDDGASKVHRDQRVVTGVHEAYRQRYGARVVWRTPRSLDRFLPEAVQDALIDLWLLRSTDAFVGTVDSTFSEMACYGRPGPVAWAGPDSRRYRLAVSVLTMTGMAWLLRWHSNRRFRRELSLLRIMEYYRGRILRLDRKTGEAQRQRNLAALASWNSQGAEPDQESDHV